MCARGISDHVSSVGADIIRPPSRFPPRRCMSGNGNWGVFRPRASDFLCGQKVTKEPSKGRGISISLSPLKSPLLKPTNLVLASSRSLALPGGARLVPFAARPLPKEAASLGFLWGPVSAAPYWMYPPRGTHPRRFFMRADIPPAGSPPIFRRGAQRAPAGCRVPVIRRGGYHPPVSPVLRPFAGGNALPCPQNPR